MKHPLAIPLVLALCGAAFPSDDVGRCPAPEPKIKDCAPFGDCPSERFVELSGCPFRQDGQCLPDDLKCRFTCKFTVHGWGGDEVCIVKGSKDWQVCQQRGKTKTLSGAPGSFSTDTFTLGVQLDCGATQDYYVLWHWVDAQGFDHYCCKKITFTCGACIVQT